VEIERDALLVVLNNWLAFEKERASEGLLPAQLEQVFARSNRKNHIRRSAFRPAVMLSILEAESTASISPATEAARGSLITRPALCRTPWPEKRERRLCRVNGFRSLYMEGLFSVLNEYKNVQSVEGEYLHLQPKDGRIVPAASRMRSCGRPPNHCRASWKSLGMNRERSFFHPDKRDDSSGRALRVLRLPGNLRQGSGAAGGAESE